MKVLDRLKITHLEVTAQHIFDGLTCIFFFIIIHSSPIGSGDRMAFPVSPI